MSTRRSAGADPSLLCGNCAIPLTRGRRGRTPVPVPVRARRDRHAPTTTIALCPDCERSPHSACWLRWVRQDPPLGWAA